MEINKETVNKDIKQVMKDINDMDLLIVVEDFSEAELLSYRTDNKRTNLYIQLNALVNLKMSL